MTEKSTNEIQRFVNDIHQGDAVETLREMPDDSIHMAMCSPPYFGLRDYGEDVESVWGGSDDCDHQWKTETKPPQGGTNTDENPPNTGADASTQNSRIRGGDGVPSDRCTECGAWRGQLGLEPRLDRFVQNLVEVGKELQRVLRDDGSWWLNLGDSFAGSGRGQWDDDEGQPKESYRPDSDGLPDQESLLRRKSKMLVPHRVAIALQDAGWIVRSDAVWEKPNPMPHPVKDRLNEQKEFIFHLTPEPDYWFDLDAIREPHQTDDPRVQGGNRWQSNSEKEKGGQQQSFASAHPNGKNPGDVFEVPTKPFPDAHFAVYPPDLCRKPIQSSAPEHVCAECGTPYERVTEQVPMWKRDPATIDRDQTKRALEIADEAGLTDQHFEAARAVGLGNLDGGDGNPYDRVDGETAELAQEAEEALGSYYREALMSETEATDEWRQTCDCETDDTEHGIVLDPFAGAGTTCLVAKNLGRRFVGIDLNEEYVAMAQQRVGITVDNPDLLLDDEQMTFAQTAGGETLQRAPPETEQGGSD